MSRLGFRWERLWDNGDYLCPVCGLPGYFGKDTFDEDEGGLIGMGICPCCRFEPGFHDNPSENPGYCTSLDAILAFREQWLKRGQHWADSQDMLWRGDRLTNPPPPDWSPEIQLARLFAVAPELAG